MRTLRSVGANASFRIRRLRHSVSTPIRETWYRVARSPADEILWTLWDHGYLRTDHLLSRRNVVAHLPQETLLNVPPEHVESFAQFGSSRSRRRFVWPGDWEERAKPIREHHRYRLMQDALHYRNDLRRSPSFQQLLRRSQSGNPRVIANKGLLLVSAEQIEAFLSEQVALLDSIAERGIRPELAVDEMNIAVGRNGTLYKVNAGRKRTMAAKLLRLRAIPVRITQVHPDWLARFPSSPRLPRSHAILKALDAVKNLHEVQDTRATRSHALDNREKRNS